MVSAEKLLADLAVGAGEGEVVEFFQRIPFAEFGGEIGAGFYFGAEGFEGDAVAGDGMFDGAEGFGADEEFAPGFLGGVERVFGRQFHFEIGEFPETGVHDASRALVDEDFVFALDDVGEEAALGGGGAFAEIGEFALA